MPARRTVIAAFRVTRVGGGARVTATHAAHTTTHATGRGTLAHTGAGADVIAARETLAGFAALEDRRLRHRPRRLEAAGTRAGEAPAGALHPEPLRGRVFDRRRRQERDDRDEGGRQDQMRP